MSVDLPLAQTAVNQFLISFFDAQIQESTKVDPAYARLWHATKEVALIGGKRLRPYLTYVGYGEINDKITPVAAAGELLHIALLIHDDIIDRDDVRHGHKNLNGYYKEVYAALTNAAEIEHFTHSAALLAGDLLISAAHSLVAHSDFDAPSKMQAATRLTRSIFEVAGGELMDTEASFMPEYYDPMTIYRYKTASYSFVGPLLTGAIIAGKTEADRRALEAYGIQLGLAYQLQDDYLGLFGEEAETGKSTFSDLREGKKTYLIEQFSRRANDDQKALHRAVFGSLTASDESLGALKAAIVASGAAQANNDKATEYLQAARQAAGTLTNTEQRASLLALVDKLDRRHA